jgi:hypothetical protein
MRSTILSLTLLLFAACNNNKEADKKDPSPDTVTTKTDDQPVKEDDSIAGVWRPVELKMEMSEEEKKDVLDKATIEFTPGGSYVSNFGPETETGSYIYNHAEKSLVTTGSNKSEERFTVAWDNGLLTLTSTKGDGTLVLKRK